MPKILLDTKALWGLIVRGSIYSGHVYEIAKTYQLIIPLPAIIEVIMAIYKVFSERGTNFEKGFEAVIEAINKLNAIIKKPNEYGIIAKVLMPKETITLEAIGIIKDHLELFVKKGPKNTRWLRLFDAIIATIWIKEKIPILADDPVYDKLAQKYKLKYIRLQKYK